jgi:sialate O-acetylesterase
VNENRFMDFGATCWYFAQRLVDMGLDEIPIGLANTAIGGQRIEEYASNATLHMCTQRVGEESPWWDAQLFATQVLPFADMTIKGWIWYQGEANMHGVKGNSQAHVGYGCEMKQLVQGWRDIWSETDNTTDPLAPFGIVTLASSGNVGGTNMGAMRQAQTANYGVTPNLALPNTFLAQAYDLDDEWGPAAGPCFSPWSCCDFKNTHYNPKSCNATLLQKCANACAAAANTPVAMSGLHPRSKKYVGDRLGIAAFNTVYGGTNAFTGPTLEGCSLHDDGLEIFFNSALLRGDKLVIQKIPPLRQLPGQRGLTAGGSQLYVQTDSSHFCMEALPCDDDPKKQCCASWAGGSSKSSIKSFDEGWIMLNLTLASPTSIKVDLSPLNGAVPTAVRYAWGVLDCCDYSDPDLYVTHGCIANCPISSGSNLPANPFQAKIVDGQCECVAPQACSLSEVTTSSIETE